MAVKTTTSTIGTAITMIFFILLIEDQLNPAPRLIAFEIERQYERRSFQSESKTRSFSPCETMKDHLE
jgi:hypothetical protein